MCLDGDVGKASSCSARLGQRRARVPVSTIRCNSPRGAAFSLRVKSSGCLTALRYPLPATVSPSTRSRLFEAVGGRSSDPQSHRPLVLCAPLRPGLRAGFDHGIDPIAFDAMVHRGCGALFDIRLQRCVPTIAPSCLQPRHPF